MSARVAATASPSSPQSARVWRRAHRAGPDDRAARACRPRGHGDASTKEYVEVTVAEALESLRSPGGRLLRAYRRAASRRRRRPVVHRAPPHRGRPHDPVVVAGGPDLGAVLPGDRGRPPRHVVPQRFTLDEGELIAYLDEDLDDPTAATSRAAFRPVLADRRRPFGCDARDRGDVQAEQDIVIRSPIDQALIVQAARHRQTRRPPPRRIPAVRAPGRLAAMACSWSGHKAFLDYIANVCPRSASARPQCTALDLCLPKVEIGAFDTSRRRVEGFGRRLDDLVALALTPIAPPERRRRVPIGLARSCSRGPSGDLARHRQAGDRAINQRRERLRVLARQALLRRTPTRRGRAPRR